MTLACLVLAGGCAARSRPGVVGTAPAPLSWEIAHDPLPATGEPLPARCLTDENPGDPIGAHVRSEAAEIRSLVEEGCSLSATFRQLVSDLARTNGLVYIERGPCPIASLRACLIHLIHSVAGVRYLWIRLSPKDELTDLLPTVAHELQHALEVLQEPWIRSRWDLEQFYRTVNDGAFGSNAAGSSVRSYETAAAIDTELSVRAELTAAAQAASAVR